MQENWNGMITFFSLWFLWDIYWHKRIKWESNSIDLNLLQANLWHEFVKYFCVLWKSKVCNLFPGPVQSWLSANFSLFSTKILSNIQFDWNYFYYKNFIFSFWKFLMSLIDLNCIDSNETLIIYCYELHCLLSVMVGSTC